MSFPSTSIGTSVWYHDSGATNHVCQEVSVLNNSSEYLGKIPLLMVDGTCAPITCLADSAISTSRKLLPLTNMLHVPMIRKNLLSISKFA